MASIIYLASPYSHINPAVREMRWLAARRFTITSLRASLPVYSPIVYGRDMEREIGIDHLPWKALNDAMLKSAFQVWVLKIDGWEDSKGVAYEIKTAEKLCIPVEYVEPIEG